MTQLQEIFKHILSKKSSYNPLEGKLKQKQKDKMRPSPSLKTSYATVEYVCIWLKQIPANLGISDSEVTILIVHSDKIAPELRALQ